MHGTFKTELRFHVRKVSLCELMALWSAVMACVPEVSRGVATFERRGRLTEQRYVYWDADELARADLDAVAGELRLCGIGVRSDDTAVHIRAGGRAGPSDFLIVQPEWLTVDITGSNERDVLALRAAIEQWGGRHLPICRHWLWPRAGVLAAGLGVVGVNAVMNDLGAADAVTGVLFWYAVFKCAELFQWAIPALRRRTLELRIVTGTRGGGRVPAAPETAAARV